MSLIKSVEYLEITLTGTTQVNVDLTKSQTIADCVPFHTVNLTSTVAALFANRFVEVFFTAGTPNKVSAQRDRGDGTCVVGVFVVEFDTDGDITVQQGTWTNAGTTATAAITAVTLTKAFVVSNHQMTAAGGAAAFKDCQVKYKFNSTTQLGFVRIADAGTMKGRYYVVATSGTDFLVEHKSITWTGTDELKETTVTAVVLAETFLMSSVNVNTSSDDIEEGGIIYDLKDTTTIRGRRAFNDFGDDTADGTSGQVAIAEVQVISAGSLVLVERFECNWADALTKTVTITEIDQTKSIIIAGGDCGIMSSDEVDSADVPANFATLKFTSNTVVTGTRAMNAAPDGTTMFEVVTFKDGGIVIFRRRIEGY